MPTYKKIIIGFVVQNFEQKGDKFICTSQEFVAGDQIDYENEYGDKFPPNILEKIEKGEIYQPFDMQNPSNKLD